MPYVYTCCSLNDWDLVVAQTTLQNRAKIGGQKGPVSGSLWLKGGQNVDSLQRMNQAVTYIEDNLANEIDFKQVERLALCSEYHFRRMFSFLAGVTVSEYIRRRRLTLAAFELVHIESRHTAPYRLPVLFFDHRPTILWYLYTNTLLLVYCLRIERVTQLVGRKSELRVKMIYQIRIQGHLGQQWANWFDGLTITQDNGDTLLTGPVIDQAALFGLLKKVRDLGTPLLSVNRIEPGPSTSSGQTPRLCSGQALHNAPPWGTCPGGCERSQTAN